MAFHHQTGRRNRNGYDDDPKPQNWRINDAPPHLSLGNELRHPTLQNTPPNITAISDLYCRATGEKED